MTFSDQIGRSIQINSTPKRIVSLVPSQTELLFDLGLKKVVVGITRFCVHPQQWRSEKTIVGGTKKIDFDVIDSLRPDLIIGNKEENTREDVERLQKRYPVWISDVRSIDGALEMIVSIGELTDRRSIAASLAKDIRDEFARLPVFKIRRTLYLIWRKPWMSAGTDTFIHEQMMKAGFENTICQARYPELSDEAIRELNPEIVLLSSEPFPFKEQHIAEIRNLLPKADILIVDGEMFSWYGSRLKKGPQYFRGLREVV